MLQIFLVYTVEARMRANTQNVQQGEQETSSVRGKEKTVWNRDMRRSVEGKGMGQGTQGKHDGHYRDFQVLTQQGLLGRKGGGFGVD